MNTLNIPRISFTITYSFNHPSMGFQNTITIKAKNREEAIEIAKAEIEESYSMLGEKALKKFTYK